MYVREIDGDETTFGVSGTLWRDALVFYDRATRTFWSQINGTGLRGPHEGKTLRELPSRVTTWGEWKRAHPDTLVLRPDKRSRGGSAYAGYFNDPSRMGVLGRENPDPRLPGKELVLGVVAGAHSAAVSLERLRSQGLIQGRIGEVPLLAVPVGSGDGRTFDRRMDGRVLGFEAIDAERLRDRETGSVWEARTGRAAEGPLEGRELRELTSMRVYWFVWVSFHPGTAVLRSR